MTNLKSVLVATLAVSGGGLLVSSCIMGYYAFLQLRRTPKNNLMDMFCSKQKQIPQQQQPLTMIEYCVNAEHNWVRVHSELAHVVPLSIQFDDKQTDENSFEFNFVEPDKPKQSVRDVALWFFTLLTRRQEVSDNGRVLYDEIAQKKSAWGVKGNSFEFEALCAVSIRTNRPIELAWTVHFSKDGKQKNLIEGERVADVLERALLEQDEREENEERITDQTNSAKEYVDLYVTATDSENYGPGYGRFVVRIFYTTQRKNEL